MWCSVESDDYLKTLQQTCANSTCHATARMRVNGVVSNMEEFAEAFQCPVGSALNPETRCRIWWLMFHARKYNSLNKMFKFERVFECEQDAQIHFLKKNEKTINFSCAGKLTAPPRNDTYN